MNLHLDHDLLDAPPESGDIDPGHDSSLRPAGTPAVIGYVSRSRTGIGTRIHNRRSVAAILALTFACACMGVAFPLMQFARDGLDQALHATVRSCNELALSATYNGWRFLAAAVLYAALTWRDQVRHNRAEIVCGMWSGMLFGGAMALQLWGLEYTLPSASAVLSALTVVFAPIGLWLCSRQRPAPTLFLGIGLALAGTAVLGLPNADALTSHSLVSAPPFRFFGELLTIGAALLFTAEIFVLNRYAPRCDARRLTMTTLTFTALFNLVLGDVIGNRELYQADVWHVLLTDQRFWWSSLVLVVASSALVFHLVTVYQPRLTPTVTAITYSTEPVFAAMASMLFITERLTFITVLGGVLVLAGVYAARPRARRH